MSKDENKFPWGKILKLFLEFIVAAITALLASFSGKAAGLW